MAPPNGGGGGGGGGGRECTGDGPREPVAERDWWSCSGVVAVDTATELVPNVPPLLVPGIVDGDTWEECCIDGAGLGEGDSEGCIAAASGAEFGVEGTVYGCGGTGNVLEDPGGKDACIAGRGVIA